MKNDDRCNIGIRVIFCCRGHFCRQRHRNPSVDTVITMGCHVQWLRLPCEWQKDWRRDYETSNHKGTSIYPLGHWRAIIYL